MVTQTYIGSTDHLVIADITCWIVYLVIKTSQYGRIVYVTNDNILFYMRSMGLVWLNYNHPTQSL